MKTVKYDVTYAEKADRMELIIRFFWMIPTVIVAGVLSFIGTIAWGLQFLHVLVFAKKHKALYEWTLKYMAYVTEANTYLLLLTDERNPIMPEI
ncbi:MAG: DUF4389 domain-containing protein [Candidatus ainarchaeum sp.]|nr:DUF4389 domain-containing protein [Candidatus ainarchaeum sp.]